MRGLAGTTDGILFAPANQAKKFNFASPALLPRYSSDIFRRFLGSDSELALIPRGFLARYILSDFSSLHSCRGFDRPESGNLGTPRVHAATDLTDNILNYAIRPRLGVHGMTTRLRGSKAVCFPIRFRFRLRRAVPRMGAKFHRVGKQLPAVDCLPSSHDLLGDSKQ
ncbi:hypothetical protein EV356DRAFT_111859 [Viridothelium virens]|uniref:Uncharacterized protein n=1 Tax=Viridothelium virens TaxID=1048519 RepID=A0A6A6HBU0_VIRVR|nr:hypothetical protein EV356DRAFT_111859 [Viridothelium virens]